MTSSENALPRTVSLREQVKAERQEAVDWVNEHSHMAVLTEEGRFRGASIVLYDHFLELIDAQEAHHAAEKKQLADKLLKAVAMNSLSGFPPSVIIEFQPFDQVIAELNQPTQEGADSSDKGTA